MADPATDPFWDDPRTAALIDLALAEDLGAGDRTSEALVPPGTPARGRLGHAAVVTPDLHMGGDPRQRDLGRTVGDHGAARPS